MEWIIFPLSEQLVSNRWCFEWFGTFVSLHMSNMFLTSMALGIRLLWHTSSNGRQKSLPSFLSDFGELLGFEPSPPRSLALDPWDTRRNTFCNLMEDLTFFNLVFWDPILSKFGIWPTFLKNENKNNLINVIPIDNLISFFLIKCQTGWFYVPRAIVFNLLNTFPFYQ